MLELMGSTWGASGMLHMYPQGGNSDEQIPKMMVHGHFGYQIVEFLWGVLYTL